MSSKVTSKKSKKQIDLPLGKATSQKELDLSHVQLPIETSVFGLKHALTLFKTATNEVKNYLAYECELMYECKLCRTIFRSLANFILHKRKYCRDKYFSLDDPYQRHNAQSQGVSIFQDDIEAANKIINDNKNDDNDKNSKRLINPIIENLLERQETEKFIEKLKNEDLSSELNNKERKKEIIDKFLLQSIDTSNVAVFQTATNGENLGNTELMKTEVMEIHSIFDNSEAVIGSNGKVLSCKIKKGDKYHTKNALTCTECNIKFSSRKTLAHHVKSKHNNTKLVYPCPECNESLSNAWSVYRHLLKVHRKTTTQIRKYRNQINNSAVAKSIDMLQQEKLEKNNMKEIKYNDEENQWLDNIEGDNDLQMCGGCGKRFERKAALTSHSVMCIKRIAVCNTIKENNAKRKELDEKEIKLKNKNKLTKNLLVGSAKRKPRNVISYKPKIEDYPSQETNDIVEDKSDNPTEMTPEDVEDEIVPEIPKDDEVVSEIHEVLDENVDEVVTETHEVVTEKQEELDENVDEVATETPEVVDENVDEVVTETHEELDEIVTETSKVEHVESGDVIEILSETPLPENIDEMISENPPFEFVAVTPEYDEEIESETYDVISLTSGDCSSEEFDRESIMSIIGINMSDSSKSSSPELEENLFNKSISPCKGFGNEQLPELIRICPIKELMENLDKDKNECNGSSHNNIENSKQSTQDIQIIIEDSSSKENIDTTKDKLEEQEIIDISFNNNNLNPTNCQDYDFLLEDKTQKDSENLNIKSLIKDIINEEPYEIENQFVNDTNYSEEDIIDTNEEFAIIKMISDNITNETNEEIVSISKESCCSPESAKLTVEFKQVENLNQTSTKRKLLSSSIEKVASENDESEDEIFISRITPYSDIKSLTCTLCNTQLSSLSSLLLHMSIHFSWYKYQCNRCSFMSFRKHDCQNHVHKFHRKNNLENIVLPIPAWKTALMSDNKFNLQPIPKNLEIHTPPSSCNRENNDLEQLNNLVKTKQEEINGIIDLTDHIEHNFNMNDKTVEIIDDEIPKKIMKMTKLNEKDQPIKVDEIKKKKNKEIIIENTRPPRNRTKSIKTSQKDFIYDMNMIRTRPLKGHSSNVLSKQVKHDKLH